MGGGSEQQAHIDQQNHGRSAAHDDGGDANPSEPIKREALAHDIRQQERARHAEPDGGHIPWCEAGGDAEAGYNDEGSPDAHGCDAVECATCVFGGGRV